MYTIIRHPETNSEIQIKTGDDILDEYQVGDSVDWVLCPEYVGAFSLLDGVYSGSIYKGADAFVVIKDHKVLAVVDSQTGITEESLISFYNVKVIDIYSPEHYSVEAWKKYEQEQEIRKQEAEKFKQSISHLSPNEQFAAYLVQPLSISINFGKLAKGLLVVE